MGHYEMEQEIVIPTFPISDINKARLEASPPQNMSVITYYVPSARLVEDATGNISSSEGMNPVF